jgi:hypothetical protein
MTPIHPGRRRALIYIGLLLMLLIVGRGSIIGTEKLNQSSFAYKMLLVMGISSIVLLVIFIVPFIVFAVKYWRFKQPGGPLPPADAQQHNLSVRISIGFFNLITGTNATLSWMNSDKVIKLVSSGKDQTTTLFEVPYRDVQRFDVDLNTLSIWVSGKTYTCIPWSGGIAATIGANAASHDAAVGAAAFAAQAWDIHAAGIPELADRLRTEGVDVRYGAISKKFEHGFDWAFGVLFVGLTLVAVFASL